MTGYLGLAAWICELREPSEPPSKGRYRRVSHVNQVREQTREWCCLIQSRHFEHTLL